MWSQILDAGGGAETCNQQTVALYTTEQDSALRSHLR